MKCAACHNQMTNFSPDVAWVLFDRISNHEFAKESVRVPVDLVLGKLAGGMKYDEIVKEYDITLQDILACLDYAAKTISGEEIRAVG
jgi:hypothetical protein